MTEEKPRGSWKNEDLWITGRTWCPVCHPTDKTGGALAAAQVHLREPCVTCRGMGRINIDLPFAELVGRLSECADISFDELAAKIAECASAAATPPDTQAESETRAIKTPERQVAEVIMDAVLHTYPHTQVTIMPSRSFDNNVDVRFDIDGRKFHICVAESDA